MLLAYAVRPSGVVDSRQRSRIQARSQGAKRTARCPGRPLAPSMANTVSTGCKLVSQMHHSPSSQVQACSPNGDADVAADDFREAADSSHESPRKFAGVQRSTKRWTASIRYMGVSYDLGTWDSAEQAARAYDRAAICVRSTWPINFPGEYDIADLQSLWPEDLLRSLKEESEAVDVKRRQASGVYIGVKHHRQVKKECWQASICFHGHLHSLGRWSTPEAAAQAYDQAAICTREKKIMNFPNKYARHVIASLQARSLEEISRDLQMQASIALLPVECKESIWPRSVYPYNTGEGVMYKAIISSLGTRLYIGLWPSVSLAEDAADCMAIKLNEDLQDGRTAWPLIPLIKPGRSSPEEIARIRSFTREGLRQDLLTKAQQARKAAKQ